MAAQTSDPEEISRIADGLTQLQPMPVRVRCYYYCFHKHAKQLLWLAQVSVCVLQHIQIKYNLRKH